MNKCFFLKKEDRRPNWYVIDATDQVLGRLATQITDSGDYVVVTNCDKIRLTGNKWEGKIYTSFSGWRSGLKERTAKQVFEKDPGLLIQHAVRGMIPKTRLGRQIIKKLKVYRGADHPHAAQVTKYGPKTSK